MRLCKDQLTGEKRPQNELYRANNGKYYTSKEAYDIYQKNLEYRQICTNKIYVLLGYKEFMKIPTFWYKKLKEWEGYGYEIVERSISNKSRDIKWALDNKSFNGETAKIMYISAIVENGLNDALKEITKERKLKKKQNTDNTQSDLDMEDINIGITNKKGNDVTSLLGDEDWI